MRQGWLICTLFPRIKQCWKRWTAMRMMILIARTGSVFLPSAPSSRGPYLQICCQMMAPAPKSTNQWR